MDDFQKLLGIDGPTLLKLIRSNPSVCGNIIGYAGEDRLRVAFDADPRFTVLGKADDHDRKHKGDLYVRYRDRVFLVESKGVQTSSIRRSADGAVKAFAQCDGSDASSRVKLKGGKMGKTVLLRVGGFDLLAIPLFVVTGKWEFAYMLNRDLPRTTSMKYAKSEREKLIKSMVGFSVPITPPMTLDPGEALDRLFADDLFGTSYPRTLPERFSSDPAS